MKNLELRKHIFQDGFTVEQLKNCGCSKSARCLMYHRNTCPENRQNTRSTVHQEQHDRMVVSTDERTDSEVFRNYPVIVENHIVQWHSFLVFGTKKKKSMNRSMKFLVISKPRFKRKIVYLNTIVCMNTYRERT